MTASDLAKTCISCTHYRQDAIGSAVCDRTRHTRTREDRVHGRVTEEVRSVACNIERAGGFLVLMTLLFDRRRLCGRGGRFWAPRAAGTKVVRITSTASVTADQQDHRTRGAQHPLLRFLRRHFRPTRRCLYDQLAIEYGHVEPDDPKAIEHFYEVTLHTLPPDVAAEILDRLMAADDMFDTGEELTPGFDASGRRYEDLPHVPPPKAKPPGDLEAYMAEIRIQTERAREAERREGQIDGMMDEFRHVIGDSNADAAAFFAVVKAWGMSDEEAQVLLGNISRDRFDALQRGDAATLDTLSDDESERLTYVLGISAALHSLYAPASHIEWLRNESRLPAEAMSRPWGTGSPLGYLLTGKLSALADVYAYVMAERASI
jgi:hypothetical protein